MLQKINFNYLHIFLSFGFSCSILLAQLGLWTSASELAGKPMAGLPWEKVLQGADNADPNEAYVSDQNSNNNVEILAAAIVYARSNTQIYCDKVVIACQKLVNDGYPALAPGIDSADNRTLAWARETGAYVLAADLVEFRTPEFETWLHNMAEVYIGADDRTLLQMFRKRPNNWGTQGFGSLCAIYAYLQDTTRLTEIRDYWIQAVTGPKPDELTYGDDLSWHLDETNLRLINPKDAIKQGLNIDGIVPDDMRRGSSFSNPPQLTGYAWETLQGMVSGARILDRISMSIWEVPDSTIYRAVYAIQVRWENEFGGWKAEGDDLWMLPFMDAVFGTNWTEGQPERVWKHGKNVGWPYVVWDGIIGIDDSQGLQIPGKYELHQNYPNPFNPKTTIRYSMAQPSHIRLSIYDTIGRSQCVLEDGFQEAGNHTRVWEAKGANGHCLASGVYFARIQLGVYDKTIKIILLR